MGYIVNACAALDEMDCILEIVEKHPFVYATVGVHPHEVGEMVPEDLYRIREFAKHKKIRAIGEIGLDYYYDNSPREQQKRWFSEQVGLARELGLPVVIHDRDAHQDTMDILRAGNVREVGGIFHCYAGSVEMAKEILDWGMYIAFGGTLTFQNAVRAIEVAKYVPLDRIVLETDCPYLAPEPCRGRRNSSLLMHYVAEKLAELRGITPQEVERITCENAKKIFRIEE